MCHTWKASHVPSKSIKHTDRRIWVQPTVGPQCKPSMCATWMRPLSVIRVDPHPLYSLSSTPKVSASLILQQFFYVFWLCFCCWNTGAAVCLCLVTITKTLWTCSLTYIQLFHVASLLRHDMSRIHKQEGSCPVMCVWLSFGCCKQAEEMWMWLTLPDWLSVLAWGYKHAFPVIYRCGAVSHTASGCGRERAKQQHLNYSAGNTYRLLHQVVQTPWFFHSCKLLKH